MEEVAVAEEGDEAGAVGMDVDGASRGGGGGWRWSRPDLQRINMRGSGKWRGGGRRGGGMEIDGSGAGAAVNSHGARPVHQTGAAGAGGELGTDGVDSDAKQSGDAAGRVDTSEAVEPSAAAPLPASPAASCAAPTPALPQMDGDSGEASVMDEGGGGDAPMDEGGHADGEGESPSKRRDLPQRASKAAAAAAIWGGGGAPHSPQSARAGAGEGEKSVEKEKGDAVKVASVQVWQWLEVYRGTSLIRTPPPPRTLQLYYT